MSSGTPYIGSKISLVSKAEIRYEGFLYTIDQNDSTVTLAKVISLGTEDRVPGQGAVPAREEVFEYIVFRGSDIKDLHVCEGPKKVEDPAIVTHSYSQSYNPNYHRGPPFPGGGVPNFGYSPFNLPQPVDIPHSNSRQPTSPNLPRNDRINQSKPQSSNNVQDNGRNRVRGNEGSSRYRDDGFSRDNRDIGNNKSNRDKYRDDAREEKSGRDSRDNRSKENRDSRSRGTRGERETGERKDHRGSREFRDDESFENRDDSRENIADKRSRDNRDNRYRDRRDKERENNKSSRDSRNIKKDNRDEEKEDQQRSASRGRGRASGRNSRRSAPRGGGSTRTKFTEDFDFESANAKFNKEEIEKELLKVLKKTKIKDDDETELKDLEEREMDERAPLPSPDKFYDRSKSFFDNILCEAMVPKSEDEIMTRRQEQALNAETFGSSAAHYRPGYRGRGRGRGRWRGQGRGFYRGRGNFRGNSNRRWVDYEFDYEAAGIKSKHQPLKVSTDD